MARFGLARHVACSHATPAAEDGTIRRRIRLARLDGIRSRREARHDGHPTQTWSQSDPVRIALDTGGDITVDEILYATGRTPNTAAIGVETVGLSPGSWLDVDDSCLVSGVEGSWLYALGDVNRRALLTHQGKYQARIAAGVIGARAEGRALGHHTVGCPRRDGRHLRDTSGLLHRPRGRIGWLDHGGRQADGLSRIKTVDVNIGESVPGANFFADGYTGQARLVIDLDRGILVGASFVGPGVAELLHSATIAVAAQVPVDRLWHAVPCFPTISEVWLRLLEAHRDAPDAAA